MEKVDPWENCQIVGSVKMNKNKRILIYLFLVITILVGFWFAKEVSAGYYSSGSLISINLLSGQTVTEINSFGYVVSSIPAGTGLRVQFSQDNSTWKNSAGTIGGWDTLAVGTNSISLSALGWSGPNFYYKMEFTSNGIDTPILDEISVGFMSFDFSISVNPNFGSVIQGGSVTTTITATLDAGATQSVSFSASGLPSGATASFSPTACNPTCNSSLTISTLSTTPAGTYPITITGIGGGWTRTTTYSLTVNVTPCQAHNVWGWAWSENIGWLSFSCTNTMAIGTGLDFGVDINPSTGNFSGYAWSENIGWIDFAPAGPYPAAPNYSARVDLITGEVSGWAKVLTDGGGWDGWLKLKDTNYRTFIDSQGQFRGWAWSDMVVGWISFNHLNCDSDNNGISDQGYYPQCPVGQTVSNYKVMTSLSFNPPPTANTLSVDSPNPNDYCRITGYPPVRLKWQFSDPGDSQSAYQIQVDTNSNFLSPEVDTGKIISGSQAFLIQPPYPTLSFASTYYWRLRVWDSQNVTSTDWIYPPSPPGSPTSPPGNSFTTISHAYPYPDFTPSPQNPTAGALVTFLDNSKCYSVGNLEYDCKTNPSNQYQWDFTDDGIIDKWDRGNTTTTYPTKGTYIAKLIITNDVGNCTTTRQVRVGLPLPEWKEIIPL